MTVEQSGTTTPPSRPINPFAKRIRETSHQIAKLLEQYNRFKSGWIGYKVQYLEEGKWHFADQIFENSLLAERLRKSIIKDNALSDDSIKVVEVQVEPQIKIASDPDILFDSLGEINHQENPQEPSEVTNPVLNALLGLKELDSREAKTQEIINKVGIVRSLGVDATLECSCLITWARKLAGHITYLLECKLLYSEDIKAKYAELLIDLNTARGVADKLIRTIGRNRGYLNIHEYSEQVGEFLRLATIIRRSSLQLSDYHEEFMTGRAGSPVEMGESIEWVIEGEEEKPRRPPPKPTTETETEEGKA